MSDTDNPNANPQPDDPGAPAPAPPRRTSPRRAVLDLAPLELDCMNTLWPLGEGTVREIRDGLAARRPRAYTTIMTIMDRLARKGIVERRKSGRAYTYRPNLTADDARSQALAQVIENFFAGSKDALVAHLSGVRTPVQPESTQAPAPAYAEPQEARRARAAAASASPFIASVVSAPANAEPDSAARRSPAESAKSASSAEPDAERIDDTLL